MVIQEWSKSWKQKAFSLVNVDIAFKFDIFVSLNLNFRFRLFNFIVRLCGGKGFESSITYDKPFSFHVSEVNGFSKVVNVRVNWPAFELFFIDADEDGKVAGTGTGTESRIGFGFSGRLRTVTSVWFTV